MIKLTSKGSWKKTQRWFEKVTKRDPYYSTLQKYGRLGVEALKNNTPVLTGLTAESWYYDIEQEENGIYKIIWSNTNVVDEWCNVALIIQLGHASVDGHWIEGIDYINPALAPVFNDMADKVWEEMTSN